ncbi:high affinity immunoglobulin epsilon receptor subunit beta-like [Polypterus senegalus]|uniref:high affinity immunoglobulin epsilon receptor subunit beta-like n=1 Tax=Polypterus senegalus TaxID=55291 RepID=UPI001965F35C|nr:high affinity immunoglobulin epsilon receptor subunit beta-like [Polypterus senegalus]XP_039621206.1 high affinity immunoglobulin epsilon receptor subunit beta-like [Polypterus senegalus]
MAEPDIEVENEEEEDNTETEHFLKRYEPACVLPRPPRAIESFLKKDPAMIGISQIVVGVISIACGATLAVSPHSLVLILRLPFITGFLFLVSGLATVLVEKKTIIFSICLAMNCGSLVSAIIGCLLYSVDLSYWNSYTNTKELNRITAVLKAILLVLTLVEIGFVMPLLYWGYKTLYSLKPSL